MSDWNEEQEKAKDVPSKKKKGELGRYVLQQRLDPDSSLARIVKKNVWAQYRDLSWADLDEASRVGRIFARKNRCYQYRLLDSVTGDVTSLNGE